ncbi:MULTISPECIES: primosomal replication protein PriC [Lonsdalea]|uniref:Prephenate dehydrogenase n=2 Tax=Lonsdalea TaxID=1082702 RepID=A0ACD1JDF8_9GAMM|nr:MULTISPECIES: primosomal replication protein [Lonsdalea]OSM95446.1 prephenate dehydrogenase [Lonsdalea populi]OSM98022.1 prephenate dehydrogenase [Lonsdalea populi]QPQ25133.1 primosomal replication protein [Lonsdalea populi]RAT13578.1 prephenate dehydrogenase [Lonsdalea quercina]RAT17614.1 prephenate dehydrogenase [Lonsdalea quercina]
MSTSTLLQTLDYQIASLGEQIAPVIGMTTARSRFDRQLFGCYGTRFGDYLAEVKQNHQHLRQYVAENRTDRVAYMAEKLLAQITALQRELGTWKMRQQNPAAPPPPADLYHKLAEHQGYERRLIAMIQDRERLLIKQTAFDEQQRLQKELAALEGRLARCRQALTRLERQIERRELGS